MKKSRFNPQQILQAMRQAEGGTDVSEICQKPVITETVTYRLRRQYTHLDMHELHEPRTLREDSAKLRRFVANPVRDTAMLNDAIGKMLSSLLHRAALGVGASSVPDAPAPGALGLRDRTRAGCGIWRGVILVRPSAGACTIWRRRA